MTEGINTLMFCLLIWGSDEMCISMHQNRKLNKWLAFKMKLNIALETNEAFSKFFFIKMNFCHNNMIYMTSLWGKQAAAFFFFLNQDYPPPSCLVLKSEGLGTTGRVKLSIICHLFHFPDFCYNEVSYFILLSLHLSVHDRLCLQTKSSLLFSLYSSLFTLVLLGIYSEQWEK